MSLSDWSWFLPPHASTFGPGIDRMYYIVLFITGAIFVVTQLVLVWFLLRYRHREGQKALFYHGSTRVEVIWTVLPFILVMAIAFGSARLWAEIKHPDNIPTDALEVSILARQFEWMVTYPGADETLGTGDDFTVRNRMDIPVNRPVKILLTADDVIHSFWVRAMRIKQDAVPGMEILVWFEPTQTGEYTIGCAELCGTGHTRMRGTLTVHDSRAYEAWRAEQITAAGQP